MMVCHKLKLRLYACNDWSSDHSKCESTHEYISSDYSENSDYLKYQKEYEDGGL